MIKRNYRFGFSTTLDYTVDIFEQIDIYATSGVSFFSIGADREHSGIFREKYFQEVQEKSMERGIEIISLHAPFGGDYDLAAIDNGARQRAIDLTLEFAEKAAEHSIPSVIIHPHHFFDDSKEACLGRSAGAVERVLAGAPLEVKFIVENLPDSRGSWICGRLLDIFGPSRLGFCYDSSHENMSGEPFHLLRRYYNRIETTHLSDNLGVRDDHLPPGEGKIDWESLAELIKKSELRDILFEVGTGEQQSEPPRVVVRRTLEFAEKLFNKS